MEFIRYANQFVYSSEINNVKEKSLWTPEWFLETFSFYRTILSCFLQSVLSVASQMRK